MKVKLNLLFVIIVSTIFFLEGCGSKSFSVKINYDLQNDFKVTESSTKKVNLFIEKFVDQRGREKANLIGEAKTGVFNTRTPIIIETDIEELSATALQEAFRKAGFNVVKEENNAELIIKGIINEFWVQEFATGFAPEHAEADVEVDVVLMDSVQRNHLWYDVKKSHIKSGMSMDSTYVTEKVINEALNEVIKSIMNDDRLAAAINSYVKSKE